MDGPPRARRAPGAERPASADDGSDAWRRDSPLGRLGTVLRLVGGLAGALGRTPRRLGRSIPGGPRLRGGGHRGPARRLSGHLGSAGRLLRGPLRGPRRVLSGLRDGAGEAGSRRRAGPRSRGAPTPQPRVSPPAPRSVPPAPPLWRRLACPARGAHPRSCRAPRSTPRPVSRAAGTRSAPGSAPARLSRCPRDPCPSEIAAARSAATAAVSAPGTAVRLLSGLALLPELRPPPRSRRPCRPHPSCRTRRSPTTRRHARRHAPRRHRPRSRSPARRRPHFQNPVRVRRRRRFRSPVPRRPDRLRHLCRSCPPWRQRRRHRRATFATTSSRGNSRPRSPAGARDFVSITTASPPPGTRSARFPTRPIDRANPMPPRTMRFHERAVP